MTMLKSILSKFPAPVDYLKGLVKSRVSAAVVLGSSIALNAGFLILIVAAFKGRNQDVALATVVGGIVTMVTIVYSRQKTKEIAREQNKSGAGNPSGRSDS